jgi:hypothetical protein
MEQCSSRSPSIVTAFKEDSDPTVTHAAQNGVTHILRWQRQQLQIQIFDKSYSPGYLNAEPKINQCVLGLSSEVTSRNVKQLPSSEWSSLVEFCVYGNQNFDHVTHLRTISRQAYCVTVRSCCAGWLLGNKLKSPALHTCSVQQYNPKQNSLFSKNSAVYFKTASLTKLVTHKNHVFVGLNQLRL